MKTKQEKRLNNRGMLSGAMPFIICVKLADHTLPFLCKSIFFLSCSPLCRIFSLPVFSFNCSHTQKAQPISLRVHLINMVQREEKQERVLKGETSASTKTPVCSLVFRFFARKSTCLLCSNFFADPSSTPTSSRRTGWGLASARDFPRTGSRNKLHTITRARATLQRS